MIKDARIGQRIYIIAKEKVKKFYVTRVDSAYVMVTKYKKDLDNYRLQDRIWITNIYANKNEAIKVLIDQLRIQMSNKMYEVIELEAKIYNNMQELK